MVVLRPPMRAKFNQINEFLKLLCHVLDDAGLPSLGRPVEILDCGCGLSYLTLSGSSLSRQHCSEYRPV
jgi:hypothetical protein